MRALVMILTGNVIALERSSFFSSAKRAVFSILSDRPRVNLSSVVEIYRVHLRGLGVRNKWPVTCPS